MHVIDVPQILTAVIIIHFYQYHKSILIKNRPKPQIQAFSQYDFENEEKQEVQ